MTIFAYGIVKYLLGKIFRTILTFGEARAAEETIRIDDRPRFHTETRRVIKLYKPHISPFAVRPKGTLSKRKSLISQPDNPSVEESDQP